MGTVNKFLVKHLRIPTKQSISIIQEKRITVNGVPAVQQQIISERDQIILDGNILQEPYHYFYYVYYKPRGIECVMDKEKENSLSGVLPVSEPFFPIGRLDKESEGLLLLTNDGSIYKKIADAEAYKEKEYVVTVDLPITETMIQQLSDGVVIMGRKTRPAIVSKIDDFSFRIILTQGLNRQIRRMCYKLGYEVRSLKRIRVMSVELGDLKPGDFCEIKAELLV